MCLKFFKIIGFLGALLCVSTLGLSLAGAEPINMSVHPIRVVMDDNYPPYVFKEDGGRLKGILVDQWRLWEKMTGIPVQLNAMDWEEAQHRMQAGEFDVIDTIFRNERREHIYEFSKPYAQIDVPIFFRTDISGIQDEHDLSGFAVGVKAGDSAVEVLKSRGVTNLVEFKSYESIVAAARDGKVNVFTVDKPPALYYLYKMGIQDRFKVSKPLYSGEFHRAVLKGQRALLEKIEGGFARISKDEYEDIEKRWYGTPILSQQWMRYISIGVVGALLVVALLFLWLWILRRMVAQRTAALEQEVQLRIQQEKLLKDSNDRFQSIFNAGNEAMFIHEVPSFKIIDVNRTMCGMYGYSREEAIHLSASDLSSGIAPYTRSEAKSWFQKAMTREPQQFEWHTKHKTGRLFWADIMMRRVTIGRDDRIIVTIRDSTDRKQMQESLRKNEEWYRLSFENVRDVIYRVDTDFILRSVSPGVERLLGYMPEELIDRPFLDLHIISSEDLPHVISNTTSILSGKHMSPSIYEFIAKGGTRLFGEVIGSPLYQDGKIIGLVAVVRDITERRNAEEEKVKLEARLRQAQKMEAIGLLAGGIAHDLNNILFPISGLSEMMLGVIPYEDPWYESVEQIHKSAQRGSELVKQILALSRQSDLQKLPIRIQPILKEVLNLSRATIPQNIPIGSQIEPNCGMVSADPTQLHQIFMNLITNAYHAVEQSGGAIHVMLKETLFEKELFHDNTMISGKYACITVQDNGVGIDPAMIDKIFTPYFTTKEQGKGTGLGLSVVHGIVQEHGGDIRVYSEAGKGTVFQVYLPLLEDVIDEMKPTAVVENLPTGCERILLIDDEEQIVLLEQMMLERLGYRVTARTSSLNALDDFRADPFQFDLVISDRSMPNMTGIQLADELIAIRPEIPIIICTGFADEKEEQLAGDMGVKGFLIKPVSLNDLATRVRNVLDEKGLVTK